MNLWRSLLFNKKRAKWLEFSLLFRNKPSSLCQVFHWQLTACEFQNKPNFQAVKEQDAKIPRRSGSCTCRICLCVCKRAHTHILLMLPVAEVNRRQAAWLVAHCPPLKVVVAAAWSQVCATS